MDLRFQSKNQKVKVIVGLGNVGAKYSGTRHNLGFFIVDYLLSSNINYSENNEFSSYFYRPTSANAGQEDGFDSIFFCKPKTFMNLSGKALSQIKNFYKLNNEDFLVIHDDLYIPVGSFKLSFNKGPGGHNGIKNIQECLGGRNIFTLRVGIGPREQASCIADYVMEIMPLEQQVKIDNILPKIRKAVCSWASVLEQTSGSDKNIQ